MTILTTFFLPYKANQAQCVICYEMYGVLKVSEAKSWILKRLKVVSMGSIALSSYKALEALFNLTVRQSKKRYIGSREAINYFRNTVWRKHGSCTIMSTNTFRSLFTTCIHQRWEVVFYGVDNKEKINKTFWSLFFAKYKFLQFGQFSTCQSQTFVTNKKLYHMLIRFRNVVKHN